MPIKANYCWSISLSRLAKVAAVTAASLFIRKGVQDLFTLQTMHNENKSSTHFFKHSHLLFYFRFFFFIPAPILFPLNTLPVLYGSITEELHYFAWGIWKVESIHKNNIVIMHENVCTVNFVKSIHGFYCLVLSFFFL